MSQDGVDGSVVGNRSGLVWQLEGPVIVLGGEPSTAVGNRVYTFGDTIFWSCPGGTKQCPERQP